MISSPSASTSSTRFNRNAWTPSVKRRWGDKITMWGSISIRTTLPQGTPDSVRKTVQQRIRQCAQDGGFVLGPANDILFDTPIENIIAMYDAARDPNLLTGTA